MSAIGRRSPREAVDGELLDDRAVVEDFDDRDRSRAGIRRGDGSYGNGVGSS